MVRGVRTRDEGSERPWIHGASAEVFERDAPASAVLRRSWERSRRASVSLDLTRAPLSLNDAELDAARRRCDWLSVAATTFAPMLPVLEGSGHMLALFDALGRMLDASGDGWTLEAMRAIHFMPGASWAEDVVGTNGPGTALAGARPVHVVGDDHYCEAWRPWHCAASPITDPVTHEIIGALDVSGPSKDPSPFAYQLALALRIALEQALAAREERRARLVMETFARLCRRAPRDVLYAVDHHGRLLGSSSADAPPRHVDLVCRMGREADGGAPEVPPELAGAVVHPVVDGGRTIGLCVLQRAKGAPHKRTTRYDFDDLVGKSRPLTAALALARRAADHELPVLILGESGVGKEVLAQAIHAASARANGPFVPVNCGAISAQLVESELFGYVSGAFSGARREGSTGKVGAANGGTLFLDEVTELPITVQATLLRLLQEGELAPVGAPAPIHADVRIIAATNRDPEVEVRAGRLRADLYYRLNVVPVVLPPLRERLDDLDDLIARLTARAERETGARITFDADAYAALCAHPWPGNVRELENLVRRLAATLGSKEISVDDLPASFRDTAPTARSSSSPSDMLRAQLVAVIERAGTMAEAAALLGMNRSTLYRQLERYGLRPKRTVGDRGGP
ncbi:sigma-54-dependent Fis family transcriptional regulator [Myxococcota bacterium]|nr:sigma-54-dependent Fis family transcriptional regulator [Myxococcota bacterium]